MTRTQTARFKFIFRQQLALLACIVAAAVASAQQPELYDELARRSSGMDMHRVLQWADRLAAEGHSDSAIAAYTVAMNRFRRDMSPQDKRECIRAHQRAAEYWIGRSANLNALQVLMGARAISEDCAADSLTVEILNNMAYVYLTFKNYEKAASMFSAARELQPSGKNPDADFRLLNNLASTHLILGETDKARAELSQMKGVKGLGGAVAPLAPYHIALLEGALCNARGEWRDGAAHVRHAIGLARQLPQSEVLECLAMEDLIKSYRGLGMKDSTLSALTRYEALASRCGLPDKRIDALRGLSEYYVSAGDRERAMAFRQSYLSLTDSVMNYREFARLNNLEFVYQTDKYKGEIAGLNKDSEVKVRRIRKQFYTIVGLGAGLLLIGGLLLMVWRQKRKLDMSYRNLYRLHQEGMTRESFFEHRREMLEGRIAELEKELEQIADTGAAGAAVREKYACSGLKGDLALALGERLRELLADMEVLCDPDLSIARLAELAGSNSKYVSQAVNETFGMNFSSLLNHRRIAEAKRRLADPSNSHLTIAAVSAGVGYRNQTSFIAAFKKAVGMTPSTYMKIAKQAQD